MSTNNVNAHFQSPFSVWLARSRAWVSISILAPFAILALLSKPLDIEGGWTDAGFDIAGWICFALGAILRWWATLYIGGRKRSALVAEGPYSMCRNPLYVGTFLMGVSVALSLMSLTFALGYLLVTAYYLTVTVRVEEQSLRFELGAPYETYLRTVPRFLLNPRLFHSPALLEVTLSGILAESKRMLYWGCLPVAGILIAQLRSQHWWPHPFLLP